MSALLFSSLAWAHGGAAAHAEPGWTSWTWAPWIVANLAALSIVYGIGWRRMRERRARVLRVPRWHAFAFYVGVISAAVALLSPVDAYSDVLGWVHMVQHTLLMMVAAPLMVFGSPGYVCLWAVPQGAWRGAWRHRNLLSRALKSMRVARPLAIWATYALAIWILHLPALYEAALANEFLHDIQHLIFFFTSFVFWRVTFDPYFGRRLNPGAGILYLFVASMHAMILGALMALSPRVWYAAYEKTAPHFGISALEDQQIAGYIMWMPAGITFVVVAAMLLVQLIREQPRT